MTLISKIHVRKLFNKLIIIINRVLLLLFTDPPIVDAHIAVGYNLESLREGDDLKLVCSVQSNPSPIEIIWFHNVNKFLIFYIIKSKKKKKTLNRVITQYQKIN